MSSSRPYSKYNRDDPSSNFPRDDPSSGNQTRMNFPSGLLSHFNGSPQEFSGPLQNNYRYEQTEDINPEDNAQQYLLNLMYFSENLPEEHLYQSLLECSFPALKTTEFKNSPHAQATSKQHLSQDSPHESVRPSILLQQTYSMNPTASSPLLFDDKLQFALPRNLMSGSTPITTLSLSTHYPTPISTVQFSPKDNESSIVSFLHDSSAKITSQPFPENLSCDQYRTTNLSHDNAHMEGADDQFNSARDSAEDALTVSSRICSSPTPSSVVKCPSLTSPAAGLDRSVNDSEAKFATKSLDDGNNVIAPPFPHNGFHQYQQSLPHLSNPDYGIHRDIRIETQNDQSSSTYDILSALSPSLSYSTLASPSHHLTTDLHCSTASGEDMETSVTQLHYDEFTYPLHPQQTTHHTPKLHHPSTYIELPEEPRVVPHNTSTLEPNPSTDAISFDSRSVHNDDAPSLSWDVIRSHPFSRISDQLDRFLQTSQLATNPLSRDSYMGELSDLLNFTQSRLALITSQYVGDTFVREMIGAKVAMLEGLVEQNSIERQSNGLMESDKCFPNHPAAALELANNEKDVARFIDDEDLSVSVGNEALGLPEWVAPSQHGDDNTFSSVPESNSASTDPIDVDGNTTPTKWITCGKRKRFTGEIDPETPKKARKNYTAAQRAVLMNFWFGKQGGQPTSEEKSKLIKATGLEGTQLMTWFQNSRRRKMQDLAQYNKLKAGGEVWDWETYNEWIKLHKEHKSKTRAS